MNVDVISEVIGMVYVVMGISMFVQKDFYVQLMEEVQNSAAWHFSAGVMPLILGALLVVNQDTWAWDWNLPVTVFAWVMFLTGIFRLWMPSYHKKLVKRIAEEDKWIYASSVLCIAIGLFFIYVAEVQL